MKHIRWILFAAVSISFWPVVVYAYEYFNPRYPIRRASDIDKKKGR